MDHMNHIEHDHDHNHDHQPPSFWSTRYGIGLLVLGAVAGYFLITEHWAHLAGFLPFLLLLSCPLMHIFMHHGHHHHGGHPPGRSNGPSGPTSGGSTRDGDSNQGRW